MIVSHCFTSYCQIKVHHPDTSTFYECERELIDVLLHLKRESELNHCPFNLDLLSRSSYSNEFQESIKQDKTLLPFVFIVMTTFSIFVFYRTDPVKSSSLTLGIGAVTTVLLSILTSFGLLFSVGVPFTNLTFMLPFIIFGIGLDGKFSFSIILNAAFI